MRVVFWSPMHGQTGVSLNLALIATLIALKSNRKKSLLFHNQVVLNTLEAYFGITDTHSQGKKGIDAVINLAKANSLEHDEIQDYADAILKDSRLEILCGTNHSNETLTSEADSVFKDLILIADMFYDYVFVDAHAGYKNSTSKVLLKNADVVVVCINQNKHITDMIPEIKQYLSNPEDDPKKPGLNIDVNQVVFLCGHYDTESKMSLKSIARKHQIINSKIAAIPYETTAKDFANSGRVFEYVMQHLDVKETDQNFELFKGLNEAIKIIENAKKG